MGDVAGLLAAMTFEEKVAVALGDFEPVAHLGVPALRYCDGPNGIRGPDNVTAFPASLALAATFDEGLAAAYGAAVASEARDTGSNVLLGPAVDIARVPLGGRLPETLGEDPHLTGRLAAAEVRAIQDRHVIAMVKHFVGNNAETGRTGYATNGDRTPAVNTVVSERALEELYHPPFKAAVQRGGAGSVMGSYNRLNGTYACQHPGILGTLKRDWGWEGFVAPDFLHAVRDPVAAANAGLDIPGLGVTEGRTAEDFATGRIPAKRLDEIVRRILFAIFDAGLDRYPLAGEDQRPALASTPGHVALATRIATDGMVLLENHDGLLPLDAGRVGSVAVIGTARDDAQWVMAGSPCVRVFGDRRVTPLEGITARAGDGVRVAFAQGSFGDAALPAVPTGVLIPPGGEGTGLLGEYWNGGTPTGEPALTRVDPAVDVTKAPEGLTAPVWSARWTGTITPTVDGPHRFTVLAAGITRLEIDGALVAAGEREFGQVFDGPPLPVGGTVDLRAGRPVGIRLDYSSSTAWPEIEPGVGGGNVRLGWQPPDTLIREAADLAAGCDVAVVFASHALGEGMDRGSLALPGDQDRLIATVAAANPRTVVVLNTGGPVLMPWLDLVGAVLQAWLPGQQFGEAVAAVLFGDADPAGRLPVTFPATPDQGPITGPDRWPGVDGDARYDEGLLVGYRWFDEHGQEPLFCFGHGLSYGDYRYGEPRVEEDEVSGAVTVSVQVTNVGGRAGVEVVQLFVGAPPAARQPPRQLKGVHQGPPRPGRQPRGRPAGGPRRPGRLRRGVGGVGRPPGRLRAPGRPVVPGHPGPGRVRGLPRPAGGAVAALDLGVHLGHLRLAQDPWGEGRAQRVGPQPDLGHPFEVEGAVVGGLDARPVGDRPVVGQQYPRAALDGGQDVAGQLLATEGGVRRHPDGAAHDGQDVVDGGQLLDHRGDHGGCRRVGVDHRGGVGVPVDELVEGELAGGGEVPFHLRAVRP
jgi:beta-glucosidase